MKKNIYLLSGILFFSLFFTSRLHPFNYEVQLHSVDIKDRTAEFEKLRNLGVGKVILRVFQNLGSSGGLYFSNSQFKTIGTFYDRLRPRTFFQNMNNIEIWAWMLGRKFDWTNGTAFFDFKYKNGSRERIKKYDLFNPDAVKRIVKVFKELAAKSSGILIQDDFYLRYNEGVSNWGKAEFFRQVHFEADEKMLLNQNSAANLKWTSIKVDKLSKVLKSIVDSCRIVNPEIKIGINIHYETPVFLKQSRQWYAHDLSKILETGIDYIYLMAYHRQIQDEMGFSQENNFRFFKKLVREAYMICGDKLIVKIQIKDWKTGELLPRKELVKYISLTPRNVKRICFTPFDFKDINYIGDVISQANNMVLRYNGFNEKGNAQ